MDLNFIRQEFPALGQKVNGKDIVYLDNAATTLKPKSVLNRIYQYYSLENANVHRGAHYLSQMATAHFEEGREVVAQFLNAKSSSEIIFVRGTTEGVNLVAASYGENFLAEGDEILISVLEHHANIVPWQMLAQKKKLKIKFVHLNEDQNVNLKEFKELLTKNVKLVCLTCSSNSLGTIPNFEKIIQLSKQAGAKVLLDGAQWVTHQKVDVQAWDCDFFVFSGHKVFGPTGIGVVYGKTEILKSMPPYQGGGSMIQEVTEEGVTFNDVPFRFEAGTPHIAGVIGLSEAIKYLCQFDMDSLYKHKSLLMSSLCDELSDIEGLIFYGDQIHRTAILSFNVEGVHHSDLAQILDEQGIAVRAGHHCNQPLMKYLGVKGTVRASMALYNTTQEMEKLINGIKKAKEILL